MRCDSRPVLDDHFDGEALSVPQREGVSVAVDENLRQLDRAAQQPIRSEGTSND